MWGAACPCLWETGGHTATCGGVQPAGAHLQRSRDAALAAGPQVVCDAVRCNGMESLVVQQGVGVAGGGWVLLKREQGWREAHLGQQAEGPSAKQGMQGVGR